jgi:uncharacterized protein YjbI with pentapeptide repeats
VHENPVFVTALLISLLIPCFWLFLWKLPQWQVVGVPEMKDRIDLESKSRQTLAQILGGAALLVGLYFTSQTLWTTQEGQITDRFTKAITQLGDHNLAMRLGGIYALERIAKDSESDHWPVMEVLTAFVREQAPAQSLPENTPPDGKAQQPLAKLLEEEGFDVFQEAVYARIQTQRLRADIQAILTVLGRRTRTHENGESQRLNLHFTNLQYADLQGAQLQGAMLDGAQLQGANLRGAKLQHASLSGADLQNTDVIEVELQDADLKWAKLQNTKFIYAKLQRARLRAARLQGATLAHCELQGAEFSGARMQSVGGSYSQFQGAMLDRAQLQGAYLDRAENLTQDQINTARFAHF